MIKTVSVKIPKPKIFNNSYIENELNMQFKNIIRWAIIDVGDDFYKVSFSYKKDAS